MRQGDRGDGRVEKFHERRKRHRHGDHPRVDRAVRHAQFGKESFHNVCSTKSLYFVITVASTFMPGRSTATSGGMGSRTIFTGMRCTTLTKLPVAFSGGSRLTTAPVAPAMESTWPGNVFP